MTSQKSIVLPFFTFFVNIFTIYLTETVQACNLWYNNNIFHKNPFLNLEILLKDIFEKCWYQQSCVVKMNSFVLFIHCTILLLSLNLFCMHFEQYYVTIKFKMSRKITIFRHLSKTNADLIKFSLAPRFQKVCHWIYNRLFRDMTTIKCQNLSFFLKK